MAERESIMPCSQSQSCKSNVSCGATASQRLRLLYLPVLLLVSLWSVPSAAQSYAYVPTHKSNTVSVINTSTNSVVAVVSVGVQPLQAAISPNGAFAYITNS